VKSIGAVHYGTSCQCAGTLREKRSPSLSRQMPKCITAPFQWKGWKNASSVCSRPYNTKQNMTRPAILHCCRITFEKKRQKNVHKDQWQQLQSCQPISFPKHVTRNFQASFSLVVQRNCLQDQHTDSKESTITTWRLPAKGKAHIRYCGQIMIPGPSEIWASYITCSFRI